MARTVKLVHAETGATIIGTITEAEYLVYMSEGYEDVTE
jgi:hypothetical protein